MAARAEPPDAASDAASAPVVDSSPALVLTSFEGNQRVRGVVRSYDPIQGRGTVSYEGPRGPVEVLLDRAEAEKSEVTNGAHITFALRDNDKCKREACDIRVLLKGVPQKDFVPKLVAHHADLDWTNRYVGIIKWFRAETGLPASIRRKDPGYGYIACRETFKLFERDVWAYPAQLQGFRAGDAVSFRVSIDHWYSWPIALDIEPAPSPLQDDAGRPACAPLAEALEEGAPAGAPAPGRPYAPDEEGDAPWQRFAIADGEGYWWWCSRSGESFLEDSPDPWKKYADPETKRAYWWKSDDEWFWVP